MLTVDRHANTSAASIPLALDEAVRDGRIRPGQHVLMEGVGGGFTWGAVLVRGGEDDEAFAFVFPGQGSQSVGMMQGFADSSEVRGVFDEASDALGQDLWKLVAEGPAEELNSTVNTQPVMLTAGYAVYRAWRAAGGAEPAMRRRAQPRRIHGARRRRARSRFATPLPLVRFRAQAMQEAVPIGQGAMAAILGLDDDAVRAACREAAQGEVVEAGQFQRAEPGRDRRAQGGGRARRGGGQGGGRQARDHAAGERAVPFVAAQARGGAARASISAGVDVRRAAHPGRQQRRRRGRNATRSASRDALARQACSPVRWVEVDAAHRRRRRRRTSPNAARARCSRGSRGASTTGLQGHAIADPAVARADAGGAASA